jgi:hypothetical protein
MKQLLPSEEIEEDFLHPNLFWGEFVQLSCYQLPSPCLRLHFWLLIATFFADVI